MTPPAYDERVAAELEQYRSVTDVHDLPDIAHYWSSRYLDAKLAAVGLHSLDALYVDPITERCQARPDETIAVASLGSGNADTEVRVATAVLEAGFDNFSLACIELNSSMQERAVNLATAAGASANMTFAEADLNTWVAAERYDVVMASHSLHHVVELEHLFGQVRAGLRPDGVFAVNDMIGRNGHMRWPEALTLVESIWSAMPTRYKYNHQLGHVDHAFVNRDYSGEGFEGIRAQEILPLLLTFFKPERFVAFANVIDVFIDRGYGHNFDRGRADDREFIDRVAQLDESAIDLGLITPTHLIATFRTMQVNTRYVHNRSPEKCVRVPRDAPGSAQPDLHAQLADARRQLERVVNSRSWRCTAPARAMTRRLARAVGRSRARLGR